MDLPELEKIVKSYMAERGSVPDKKLKHRLHSNLWHRGADRDSKEFGCKLAKLGLDMWRRCE